MKDNFLKTYIYLLIAVAVENLVYVSLYIILKKAFLMFFLVLVTIVEYPLLLLSVAVIIYLIVKKLNRIYLVLPVLYLALYITFTILARIMAAKGIAIFDFSYASVMVMNILMFLFYFLQIVFGVYLLRKKV